MKKPNLTEVKPYARIALVLGVMAIVLLTVVLINSYKKSRASKEYLPPPLPSLNPQRIPQAENFETELAKIMPTLPHFGQDFTIRYRGSINILAVEINVQNREDFVAKRREAEVFLKSKGVTNLCTLNIFWQTPENSTLYQELEGEDILTTGCAAAIGN